jgi:hypothetical protein
LKRLVLFAIALLGTCAGSRAEDLSWFTLSEGRGATLIYGIPDSGYAPISFRCERPDGNLAVVIDHEPINAVEGMSMEVLLSAGDIEVPVATKGARLEMDNLFILEGEIPLDARLEGLLTSAGPLNVTIEDGAEEYPLADAEQAVRDLVAACKPE